MIVLLQVLAVLAVVFGVAVVLTGRTEGLSEEAQDLADTGIPRDRAMSPHDVVGLRFALAFRGYRMNEVDDALDRLAAELAARDEEIQRLRAEAAPAAPETATAPSAEPQGELTGWEREAYVPSDATGDLPDGVENDVLAAPDAGEPDGFEPEFRAPEPEPDPEATQAMPVLAEAAAEPEFTAPPVPEADGKPLAAPGAPPAAPPAADSPIFGSLTPPSDGPNPFRPEVPEIPTYDPWSVTPKSRYTEGPTYVEVDDETDDDETVDAIAEHHTGYAPPPESTEADEERPPPPWQR